MTNTCVVCEYGWIIVGRKIEENADLIRLSSASVVRSWGNGKGIGAIALRAHKDEYMLDQIGDVNIRKNKVLFEIPCEW